MAQMSDVESILNKLTKLEEEIENINSSIEEIRKKLILFADKQIEELREKLTDIAKAEAERIINKAKREAEGESNRISVEADRNLVMIEGNVKKAFNNAVEMALKKIIEG